MVQKVALARWSRTFSGMIASGVPILQAIEISGETCGNAVITEAMDDVYASVKRGGTIAQPIGAARRSSRRWSSTWSPSGRSRDSSRRC